MTDNNTNIKAEDVMLIECPSCKHKFDISEFLEAEFKEHISSEAIEKLKIEFEEKRKQDRQNIYAEAREQADAEIETYTSGLNKQITAERQKSLNLTLGKQDQERKYTELKTQFEDRANLLAQEKQNETEADYLLKLQTKEEENRQLRSKIENIRTAHTSSQVQGEAGEINIETYIRKTFPHDRVEEVKKGQGGADITWTICDRSGREISKIYIESKFTQAWQKSWVDKFKTDLLDKRISLGVLVTKTMPANNPVCHFAEGFWTCGFHEYKLLLVALRQGQILLNRAQASQAIKEEQAQVLFDFVIGEEFFAIMERILRPIQEQKEILQSEKNSVTRLWRRREKGIEKSIQGAALLAGQLDSILGSELTNQIGFDRFDLTSLANEAGEDD
jgi:hypothetical protein